MRTNRPRSPRFPPVPARRRARPDNADPRCDRCRSRRRGTHRAVPSRRGSRSPPSRCIRACAGTRRPAARGRRSRSWTRCSNAFPPSR
ncbi:MAG: hypothetical protein E6J24_04735, partial [Chloroflexi bacterium]